MAARTGRWRRRGRGCSATWGGIFGRPVALSSGDTLIADDQYLSDSILLPNKQVVAGYDPIMPTYGNVLRPEQVNALVAYLKSTRASKDSP